MTKRRALTTDPGLNFRRSQLLAKILKEGGRWTTVLAFNWYRDEELATQRSTARGDLNFLADHGYLLRVDDQNDRYFVPASTARTLQGES